MVIAVLEEEKEEEGTGVKQQLILKDGNLDLKLQTDLQFDSDSELVSLLLQLNINVLLKVHELYVTI